MNVEELKEDAEHAHAGGQKKIGLTMAITAVMLAVATLLSHRAHTEEVLLQGKIVDDWNFYQAKHSRSHEYAMFAVEAALLPNGKEEALREYKKSLEEECGSPAEKGCTSPAKDSPIIRTLIAQSTQEPHGNSKQGSDKGPTESKAAESGAAEKSEHKSGEAGGAEKSEHKSPPGKLGAVHIQEQAREKEKEREIIERQANFYDSSELFLEISIVLCSISLLTGGLLYWRLSFLTTAIGIAVALWGLLALH
ncbi:MAG TPA: DUF4337 family protein [Terriglobales bacterium]|nr:DUF4337 family protein [Terriglobales bacterium]